MTEVVGGDVKRIVTNRELLNKVISAVEARISECPEDGSCSDTLKEMREVYQSLKCL